MLIVDDHDFFAACLRAFLDNESDLAVCDVAGSSGHLTERIERLRPDLLVIDLTLGTESGLQLGQRLREADINIPILFVSTLNRPSRDQLEEVSHCAFSLKGRGPAEFLRVLREMIDPREVISATEDASFGLLPIKQKV